MFHIKSPREQPEELYILKKFLIFASTAFAV